MPNANSKRQEAFYSRPEEKRRRASRARARYWAMKRGLVKKGDGKVVHHKNRLVNGGSNSPSNLAVQSEKASLQEGGRVHGKKKRSFSS